MAHRPREHANSPFPERWGKIQESLAKIAGIALVTIDAEGRACAEAGVPALCRLLENHADGRERCAAWCGRHRDLALRENRTFFYRCHAGLQCFAAPIRVEERAVLSVLGGRTLEHAADVDGIFSLARGLDLPGEEVRTAVGALTLDSPRLLARAADLVAQTAAALFTGERRLQEVEGRLALLTSLLALGTDFARERDLHEVHAMILDAVAILFDIQGACLLIHDEQTGSYRLRTAFGTPERLLPAAGLSVESPLLAPVLRDRMPSVTDDLYQILRQGFPDTVRSLALYPLVAGDHVLGVIGIVNTPLAAGEAGLLQAFCHQAALALQNALLRDQLRLRTLELERLRRLRERLAPLLDWDDVLQAVFEEATGLAGAGQSSLMLIDRKTRALRVQYASGDHAAVLRTISLPAGEGIAGRVADEGRPFLVEDLEQDERLRRPRRPRYRTGSCLVVPLKIQERVIGVINLADKTADASFSPEDLEAVLALTAQASCALQRSALHRQTRALREMAVTDPLTRLANRRCLEERLREEAERARRYGAPLAFTMIDLDDFKTYNDREGHPAGDRLLREIAHVIRAQVRTIDLVARYGGEEFAILSPHTSAEEALLVAERIREAMAQHAFALPGLPEAGGITLSAGVAIFPEVSADPAELVRSADRALYQAKSEGKNRVARFTP